ncbi:TetR/AcrR family transcriptional regulator [Neptunicoccus cionae]|uniref:TetR/AcrR family transcriptional regulator n=1 Tax=Neptunicoccus cionae TaxID=2035344 RepID=UPI0011AE18FF|nr:TetR family transcriptional regulator [Amylibacter cionae]
MESQLTTIRSIDPETAVNDTLAMTELSGFPTRKQLRDLKRREIVRCATVKFGTEGYENVTLEAIATELGVTKAALYNYCSSKNDLLMQCYELGMDRLVDAVETAMAGTGSAAERLAAGLKAYIVTMLRPDMQYLWSYTRPMVTSGDKRSVLDSRDKLDVMFRNMLNAGISDGSLRADLDPKLASLVILGAANWVGIWYRKGGGKSPSEIGAEVTGEALRGYLA